MASANPLAVVTGASSGIGYELANRPAWVEVPLRGLQLLLDTEDAP